MKGKKKILGLAIASCALTLGMAFVACNEESGSTTPSPQKTITLENFTDVTATLALGEGYELPEKAYDAEGNAYDISYSVKTESGKELGLLDDRIFARYLETHYVVGTVEVATGDIRTQKITLTVTDEGNPWITFGEVSIGQQGVEYALPEITVNDDSGEKITPEVKLYVLNGDEKGAEVATENGAFTPAVGGYYYLEAKATDSTGNVGTAAEVVYVRANTTGTATIVTFNDQAEVDANFQFTARDDREGNKAYREGDKENGLPPFEKKYIPEFAGEKNVVQVRYKGTYWAPRFSIVPTQSVAADAEIFQKYTHVVVRMYVVKSDKFTNYWHETITMRNVDSTSVVSSTGVRQNEWVDYAFPIEQLVDFSYWPVDENGNLGTSKTEAAFIGHAEEKIVTDTSGDAAHEGMYYVSTVYVTNMATVATTGDTLNQPVTVSATVGGENVDLSSATVRVKKPNGAILRVKGASFTPDTRGTYEITVDGDGFLGTTSVSFIGIDRADELISFDHSGDESAARVVGAGGSVKWVAEYAGKTGVLQYDITGASTTNKYAPSISFDFMQSYDELIAAGYADNDYFVVQMYTVVGDDTATEETETFSAFSDGWKVKHNGGSYTHGIFVMGSTSYSKANEWVEYAIPLKILKGWTCGSSYTLWNVLNAENFKSENTRLYIADISVKKADLNVTVSGTSTSGETVTVSATDGTGAAVDMTAENVFTGWHIQSGGSRRCQKGNPTFTLSTLGEVAFVVNRINADGSVSFGVAFVTVVAAA